MPTNIRSAWPQVVGQAWADEEFRRRLLENPRRVLDELGVEIPADHQVELLEDTHTQTFLVLPQKPEHLDALASANGSSLRSGFERTRARAIAKAVRCRNDPRKNRLPARTILRKSRLPARTPRGKTVCVHQRSKGKTVCLHRGARKEVTPCLAAVAT